MNLAVCYSHKNTYNHRNLQLAIYLTMSHPHRPQKSLNSTSNCIVDFQVYGFLAVGTLRGAHNAQLYDRYRFLSQQNESELAVWENKPSCTCSTLYYRLSFNVQLICNCMCTAIGRRVVMKGTSRLIKSRDVYRIVEVMTHWKMSFCNLRSKGWCGITWRDQFLAKRRLKCVDKYLNGEDGFV